MRVMITGGGTGGHTSPAVAIVEELRRRDPRLLIRWVGRSGGMEETVSRNADVPFRGVPVEGWPRRKTPRMAWTLAKLAWCVFRCALMLRAFRPRAVVGVGGYVSLPLVWAAQRMGIPTFLHEQNKRLGMANRLCAARATRLFLSYPDTIGNFPAGRARVVGNPVRSGFISVPPREEALARFGLTPGVPVVLSCGGSQGARTLNRALSELVGRFTPGELQFLWMTGKSDAPAARETAAKAGPHVHVFPFIEDMPAACAAADVIVSRAGASSTAEIAVLGKPSILVPYPFATDNHQEHNARAFEEAGAAVLVRDADCTADRLEALLRGLLADPDRRATMGAAAVTLAHPLAAETIVEQIIADVYGGGGEE